MDSSYHVPPYLLCEKLADGAAVVDLFPPDEDGSRFLARSTRFMFVVQRTLSDHSAEASKGITRLLATPLDLPLARGSFDLVMALFRPKDRQSLEEVIRSSRTLVNPSGVVAVMIPNRDSALQDPSRHSEDLPDFLEFERGLRRHFPHVTLYAQLPLYGAVLSPLGRRQSSEGPLLDDRLVPEGGETPTHFLALCSLRYRKMDDTTIAQLPFQVMSDRFRQRIERLEGAVTVIRKESDSRGQEIDGLRSKLEENARQLEIAEAEAREKAGLSAELAAVRDKLAHRERLLAEMEESQKKHAEELNEKISSYHEATREIRKLEQQLADSERVKDLSRRDREESEADRQNLLTQLHDLQNELKGKQRDLDDKVEQVAGVEAELAALHKEASKQRRELLSNREQVRKLTLQIQDIENSRGNNSDLENELDRFRGHAAAERERLEKRADEEHRLLLEAIAEKEAARREAQAMEVRLKEVELSSTSAEARIQQLKDQLGRLSTGSRDTEKKKEELSEELRQLQRANEQLGIMVQEKSDELERQAHVVELLTARTRDAESRNIELLERAGALEDALAEAERKASYLKTRTGNLEDNQRSMDAKLESALQSAGELQGLADAREIEYAKAQSHASHLEAQLLTLESELEEEVERSTTLEEKLAAAINRIEDLNHRVGALQPDASASKNARQRAMTAEAAVSDLENVTEHMREELLDARTQVRRLEEDLSNAMAALASKEEGTESLLHDSSERIRVMKAEMLRMKEESEAELMKVTEDMELELRHANSMLEARHGELWELREEVVRLRAQGAASIAAAQRDGRNVNLQKHLDEQEDLIQRLKDERNELRSNLEKQERSLDVRKKNLKILAALLRKERATGQYQGEPPDLDSIPPDDPGGSLDTRKLDIKSLIEEAGGIISDEAFEEFDEALQDDFLESLPTGKFSAAKTPTPPPPPPAASFRQTEEEVDSVMDSVVVEKHAPRRPKPKKPSR